MKSKKLISFFMALIILFSGIVFPDNVYAGKSIDYYKGLSADNIEHIPAHIPGVSANGYPFNDYYWTLDGYRVIVYGSTSDVPGNEGPLHSPISGKPEYRYLGFDSAGNKFSNELFKNDADSGIPLANKNWIHEPWYEGLCISTDYSRSTEIEVIKDINKIYDTYKFYPHGGTTFMGYGNVQSYPTLLAPGSFRMWHRAADGKIWYQTFAIPKKTGKLDTPYQVTTEILSNDFTIDLNEITVDVVVKVTFKLNDEAYYTDSIQKAIHYTRDDIKRWDMKVEYKGTEVYKQLNPNGSNTMSETFTIKLSRSQIVDKEKITFIGVGRVTFHNEKYYRDLAPEPRIFTVVTPPPAAELPPDLTITAPAKVNIKESYTVKVNPIVPQGESIKSVVLEASLNGGAYLPVTLSSYSASQQYDNVGAINYRATVTLNNNKTATATATTNIVDERSSTAKAKIEQPSTAYEGHWLTVYNRNTFTFEGTTYNAQQASGQGIGSSDFDIQENSHYPLSGSLYQTRNYNSDVSFDIRYLEPGMYKNTIWAIPRNGDAVSDTRGIQILRCPAIIASIDGSRKSNRKMMLDFSRTVVHPDYPLASAKTSVVIEDTVTGEKVTVTNAVHPDSTNIKTNALSGNKMDFLIKTATDKAYRATIYVEDTRGNTDTQIIDFTVVQDKAPIAKISAQTQELRKPSLFNKAEIFLQDDSYSEDGDYITRTWEAAIDTDNDGVFTDETYRVISTLDGFQDLSGDGSQKKVRFLKTGVGKIDARVKVKEVFGQPTIEAFVTAADRKETVGTKVVEVLNVAPVVDFKIFSNISTTINIVVGKLSDALQTSAQNYIATMQSQLLGSKITPTINFIPLSRDKTKEVWSQPGGNAQKNGYIPFDGPLNLTQKWQIDLQDVVHNDEPVKGSQCFILPNGNLLVSGGYYYRDEALNKYRYHYYIKSITPEGTMVKDINVETTAYNVNIGTPISFVMSNGNILGTAAASSGKTKYVLYDSNLNIIKEVPDTTFKGNLITHNNIIYSRYSVAYNPIQGSDYTRYKHYLRAYDSNLNLLFERQITTADPYNGIDTYYSGSNLMVVDPSGNCYTPFGRYLVKIDLNGNIVWAINTYNGDDIRDMAYDVFTDKIYTVYEYWIYDDKQQYIQRNDPVAGVREYQRYYLDNVYGRFDSIRIGKDYLYVNTSAGWDYVRKFDKISHSYVNYFNTFLYPSKAIAAKDGAELVVTYAMFGCTFLYLGNGSGGRIGTGNGGTECYMVSSGVFGTNNTVYLVGAYYYRTPTGNWPIDRAMGPMFIKAIGTGGTEQNVDNTLRKINDNIPSGSGTDFVVSITDSPYQDNSDANITNTANLLKNKNDRFFMIGNSSSKPDGQKILNKGVTGDLYDINSNMSTPLAAITNYIKNLLAPVDKKVYEYHYEKGEIVNYDVFYTDYELDPSKASQWRYVHTPKTDGVIANNGVWLSAPITQFTKNGTYQVQHRQMDNTGVAAYDKYSNIIELTIHVEDGTVTPPPPPPVYTPTASIELEGYKKQNRKLTLKLNYSTNNALPLNASTINWTLTPVSGMAATDIKRSSLVTQNIDTLYKKSGRVRAICTFKDSNNNVGSVATEFDITADLAPTGTLQVIPVTYRNASGIAAINVKANVTSPDDYIAGIKYYITYDADNNGSYTNNTKTYLPQFDNLREFNYEVSTGVGNYLIQVDVTEGFNEPTIPAYITSADYLTLALQGTSKVDNIAPTYDVKPEKGVYLIGEEIRFNAYDGSLLNGDAAKGFFDSENDAMTGFNVKYIQNKAVMPIQDANSAYHNQTRTSFLTSLDRAGEYTIDVNAFDDPKAGDIRFDAFKKPSNTCSNKIIVHRRPAAALAFTASHNPGIVCDFGNNMYLDGTQLKITDTSSDPDGFAVISAISYKADSGNYVILSSGDTINLYYGSVFTVKVTTTDNWGADDTNIYVISVVPDINMVPEVIPHTIKVGNNGTLRLTTNQYATSARAVVFGVNRNLTLISSTATEKIWQSTFNVPGSTPIAQFPVEFYATAEGMAEQRKDTHFHTTLNSPPVVDITGINPSVVYEGDDVSVTFQPSDPDLDTLSGLIELYNSSNTRIYTDTITIVPNGSSYGLVTNDIANDIDLGSYRVEVTVTDPYGESEKDTYSFTVLPLSVAGQVNHTTLWNEHRQNYNISKTGNPEDPRLYDEFFPGERFILNGSTTVIDPSRPDLTAETVSCELLSYGFIDGLSSFNGNSWEGDIWDADMIYWDDQSLTFRFTVNYSNGTVKTSNVTVYIIDDEYWRQHMKF